MAWFFPPGSFECDCGHLVHHPEHLVNYAASLSVSGDKPIHIGQMEPKDHRVEMEHGKPVAMICPKLGRLPFEIVKSVN